MANPPSPASRRFRGSKVCGGGTPPEQLVAALLSLGEGVTITGTRWIRGGMRMCFVNEAFATMTGYTMAELSGQNTRILAGPHSNAVALHRWLQAAHPAPVHRSEGYLYRKDGSSFHAAWTCRRLSCHGRNSRIVAVFRDMTEMRGLQDALVHSQRLDAIGQLARGVAHDFNNLLSVINGHCEILGERLSGDAAARRDLDKIHTAGRRAASLTRQLLAFSRRQEMNPKVINLSQVVRELNGLLHRLVGRANTLVCELANNLANVRADPAQIQQVILNLVVNARDALPPAGGSITIRTANTVVPARRGAAPDLQAGRYVTLAVQDTGGGMDDATQQHLFEPFFTTKEPGQGTGLGLASVYGIIQQSGGYITVRSGVNAGSAFKIYLPEVSAPVEVHETAPAAPFDPRGGETILLLEEDGLVGKMVAGILTSEGYEVLAANRPADALALAKQHGGSIDLLIADLRDARGHGFELARELHSLKPGFRILGASNLEEPRIIPWLPAAHQAPIAKPFALSELLRQVRELLDAVPQG
jgi:two-component system cell cycle sensor histidine kinase/response regulator CckA